MVNITFKIYHDRLTFGPFPVRELNALDGVFVTVRTMPQPFQDEVTINILYDEDIYAAIFVVGQYTYQLMQKQLIAKQN